MHRRETTSSSRWCIGRGVSVVLAVALSLLVPAVARAGLATSDTIGSGDVGKTLKNNTVYVVPHSVTLTRTTPYTALYVEPGATTVLYIPNGVTLTVNGGDASGTEGAGAGIRVDSGSTLVVTGEGTLNVSGGNAANRAAVRRMALSLALGLPTSPWVVGARKGRLRCWRWTADR